MENSEDGEDDEDKKQNDFDSVKNYAPSDIQEEQNISDFEDDDASIQNQDLEFEPVELKHELEEVQEEPHKDSPQNISNQLEIIKMQNSFRKDHKNDGS